MSNSSSSATSITAMLSQKGIKVYTLFPEYRENIRTSQRIEMFWKCYTVIFSLQFCKEIRNRSMWFLLLATSTHNLVTLPVPLGASMVMQSSTCTQQPSTITFPQNQIKLDWLKIKVLPGNIILSVFLWETSVRVLVKQVKSILAASIFIKIDIVLSHAFYF